MKSLINSSANLGCQSPELSTASPKARGRKRTIDLPKWQPGWSEEIFGYKDVLTARARFKGTYGNAPERLARLESADRFNDAFDLDDWRTMAETYPDQAIAPGGISRYHTEDGPIRAYELLKMLTKLIELEGPSERKSQIIEDLKQLCGHFIPAGALRYAKIQEVMIDNPGSDLKTIARLSGADVSTVQYVVTKRIVIWPRA